ncbi:MAG: transcription antitermination factor NusB [Gammaproteobacteria bacterium]|nr:MAG: transcription antitermination factor NusB [Gammaproteobacteria bacterium]
MSRARSRARQLALQALYQWHVTRQDSAEISAQFAAEQDLRQAEVEYFQELLKNIALHHAELDALYAPLLDRPLDEVDPVECAILRIGAYELQHRPDIPYRVVINEALELAKLFGSAHSHKYINGILDKLARQLRAAELAGP